MSGHARGPAWAASAAAWPPRGLPASGRRLAVAVLAAHALLLLGLLGAARVQVLVRRDDGVARLSLLSEPAPRTPLQPVPPPPRRARTPTTPPVAIPRVPVATSPDRPALPAPTPEAATAPVMLAPPPASSAPLQLSLSRDQLKGFARPARPAAAAFARVVKLHGEKVADAIDQAIGMSDDLVVESLGDGSFRAHYGRECTILKPTEMSRLDPTGHAHDFMLVEPCKR